MKPLMIIEDRATGELVTEILAEKCAAKTRMNRSSGRRELAVSGAVLPALLMPFFTMGFSFPIPCDSSSMLAPRPPSKRASVLKALMRSMRQRYLKMFSFGSAVDGRSRAVALCNLSDETARRPIRPTEHARPPNDEESVEREYEQPVGLQSGALKTDDPDAARRLAESYKQECRDREIARRRNALNAAATGEREATLAALRSAAFSADHGTDPVKSASSLGDLRRAEGTAPKIEQTARPSKKPHWLKQRLRERRQTHEPFFRLKLLSGEDQSDAESRHCRDGEIRSKQRKGRLRHLNQNRSVHFCTDAPLPSTRPAKREMPPLQRKRKVHREHRGAALAFVPTGTITWFAGRRRSRRGTLQCFEVPASVLLGYLNH